MIHQLMNDEFNYLKEELIEGIPGRLHFSYDLLGGNLISSLEQIITRDLNDSSN